jgi:SAM-dependent methyltransferase
MLSQAQAKISNLKIVNMTTVIDPETLRSLRFDFVFTSMALHHIRDLKTQFDFFADILNPGGLLCIIDLNPDDGAFHRQDPDFDGHNGFDQEKLSASLADHGLKTRFHETFFQDTKASGSTPVPYSLFILAAEKTS